MIRSSAGLLPSADWAPAECDRRCVSDFARIAVPRQRRELLAQRRPKQVLEPPWLNVRQLSDRDHTGIGQPRLGDGAYAPHQLDR